MKQVKHDFKVLSKQVCRNCGKPLKLNVILRKHNPLRLCYKCYIGIKKQHQASNNYRRNIECGNGNV